MSGRVTLLMQVALLIALAASPVGCATRPAPPIVRLGHALMSERGLRLAEARPFPGGTVRVYRPPPGSPTTVVFDSRTGDAAPGDESSPWFAARLGAAGGSQSLIFFGRPSSALSEVCADADWALATEGYWCAVQAVAQEGAREPSSSTEAGLAESTERHP